MLTIMTSIIISEAGTLAAPEAKIAISFIEPPPCDSVLITVELLFELVNWQLTTFPWVCKFVKDLIFKDLVIVKLADIDAEPKVAERVGSISQVVEIILHKVWDFAWWDTHKKTFLNRWDLALWKVKELFWYPWVLFRNESPYPRIVTLGVRLSPKQDSPLESW